MRKMSTSPISEDERVPSNFASAVASGEKKVLLTKGKKKGPVKKLTGTTSPNAGKTKKVTVEKLKKRPFSAGVSKKTFAASSRNRKDLLLSMKS